MPMVSLDDADLAVCVVGMFCCLVGLVGGYLMCRLTHPH